MMSTQQNLADAHSTELEVLAARLIDNHPFDTDDAIFEALKHAYELGKQHQDQAQLAGAERFLIEWEIDVTNDATTPREAALAVWHDTFGHGEPGPEDACVFTITDRQQRTQVQLDLAYPSGEDVLSSQTL